MVFRLVFPTNTKLLFHFYLFGYFIIGKTYAVKRNIFFFSFVVHTGEAIQCVQYLHTNRNENFLIFIKKNRQNWIVGIILVFPVPQYHN